MPSAWAPERLVEEVERLSIRGLPRHDYFRELTLRLQRTIPFGGACWHSLDPRTLLMTSVDPTDLYERLLPPEIRAVGRQAMLASEYQRDDVNTFAELARRRIPVGTLLEATAGCPERSARYRELFAPVEASDELRAAFVARKRGWGSVVLARRGSRPFTTTETRLIARLSGPVAEGLRAAIRSDAVRAPESANAPGLVVLGPRNEIEMITPSARELLDAMRRDSPGTPDPAPPPVVLALAASARNHARDHPDGVHSGLPVPTSQGWLSLHASLPDGTSSDRVAIILQPARSDETAPLRLEANGLTPREREITMLLVSGLTTTELASRLYLSPHTVHDHVKSIFSKTGTRNRRQLVAQIFYEEYLPKIAKSAPPAR